MTKEKKKSVIKRIVIILTVAAVILAVTASLIFFPLKGKKHIEIWGPDQEFSVDSIKSLEMENDEFRILVFADTQLWHEPSKNKECYNEMDSLVEKTSPDLIVTVGDNLSGLAARFSIGHYIDKIESYGIPWAPVYGNHDNEMSGTTLNWQTDRYMTAPHCLMEKGPSNLYGCGNYVININKGGKNIYSLIMLDNGRYIDYGGTTGVKESYMSYEQIAWYKWVVTGLKQANGGETVPSMTFSHFGQPEIREAIEQNCIIERYDTGYVKKITIPEEAGTGHFAYLPSTAPVNSGFVDVCNELGSTKYFFSGHDHENYGSIYGNDGNVYTYTLKTGPSPTPWTHSLITGGTLITIDSSANVDIEHIVISDRSDDPANY